MRARNFLVTMDAMTVPTSEIGGAVGSRRVNMSNTAGLLQRNALYPSRSGSIVTQDALGERCGYRAFISLIERGLVNIPFASLATIAVVSGSRSPS